jgi:RNA polymerase sigma factor (sigma-70 family)
MIAKFLCELDSDTPSSNMTLLPSSLSTPSEADMSVAPAISDPVQAWLTSHKNGENPPVEDLCRFCQDRVRLLVRPRLRRFPDVRREVQTTDILDDAMMKLIGSLKTITLDTVFDLNCYLAKIIRWVLLDRLRKIQLRRARFAELPSDLLIDADISAGIDFETMSEFHEFVETLPDPEVKMFELIYYRGMTTEQAADQLEMPPTTLKRKWIRARLLVRQKFDINLDDT